MLAAEAQGIKHVQEITSRRLMLLHVSNTFHGRDVFAPVAAHLANGVPLDEFGHRINDAEKPAFTEVTRENDTLKGEVMYVDGFGNIITNIHAKDIDHSEGHAVQVELRRHKLELRLTRTYAHAKLKEPLALIGSHGYLEIAVNQGNAATKFKAKSGDKIKLSFV
jgi:S-adenosylmethionine hydrolase